MKQLKGDWKKVWFDYNPESTFVKNFKKVYNFTVDNSGDVFGSIVSLLSTIGCLLSGRDYIMGFSVFFLVILVLCVSDCFDKHKMKKLSEKYFKEFNKILEQLNSGVKLEPISNNSFKLKVGEVLLKNIEDRIAVTTQGLYLRGKFTSKYISFHETFRIIPTLDTKQLSIEYYDKPTEWIRNFLSPKDAAILHHVCHQCVGYQNNVVGID